MLHIYIYSTCTIYAHTSAHTHTHTSMYIHKYLLIGNWASAGPLVLTPNAALSEVQGTRVVPVIGRLHSEVASLFQQSCRTWHWGAPKFYRYKLNMDICRHRCSCRYRCRHRYIYIDIDIDIDKGALKSYPKALRTHSLSCWTHRPYHMGLLGHVEP